MRVVAFFLASFLCLALQAADEAKDVSQLFPEMNASRHLQYQALFKKIFVEEKACLSVDYDCILKEITQLKVKSQSDFYSAMNLLTSLYQKKLSSDPDCQEVCRINLNAKFIDAAFSLIEVIKLDDMLMYSEFKGEDLTHQMIRAGEDLAVYKYLLRIADKMHQLQARIINDKIFDPRLALRAKDFPAKIAELEKARFLNYSQLAKLKKGSREYDAFLRTAGDDEKSQQAIREAVEKFHKGL